MRSALGELRALCPAHALAPWEVRGVAERQAMRLLRRWDITEPPIPDEVITEFPYVRVRYVNARTFAATARWKAGAWTILVNRNGTAGRQRFSLAHEFKHVLDHHLASRVYRSRPGRSAHLQAERAADVFAAALLMPRTWVKSAFYAEGIRDERVLARRFGVSVAAMRVRADELRLFEPGTVAA